MKRVAFYTIASLLIVALAWMLIKRTDDAQIMDLPPVPTSPVLEPSIHSFKTVKITPPENKELKVWIVKAKSELPLIAHLSSKHSGHHPPAHLTSGSDSFGKILDHLHAHPKESRQAVYFFKECAERSDVLDAIRITCARYFLDWARYADRSGVNKIPLRILRIAEKLPRSR